VSGGCLGQNRADAAGGKPRRGGERIRGSALLQGLSQRFPVLLEGFREEGHDEPGELLGFHPKCLGANLPPRAENPAGPGKLGLRRSARLDPPFGPTFVDELPSGWIFWWRPWPSSSWRTRENPYPNLGA
jgi:hypothetical protein